MQPFFRAFSPSLLLLTCAALNMGCLGGSSQPSGQTQYLGTLGGAVFARPITGNTHYDSVSYWDGDGVQGKPSIQIDLGEQKAYFYKGSQLVGVSRVSTGREGYSTPDGNFKVTEKDVDHRSNLYGSFVDQFGNTVVEDAAIKKDKAPPGTKFKGAPMFYFMRVHGAIGMHAGYLPGYAASHGCIRMPERMAKKFYENAPHGTPVSIVH